MMPVQMEEMVNNSVAVCQLISLPVHMAEMDVDQDVCLIFNS